MNKLLYLGGMDIWGAIQAVFGWMVNFWDKTFYKVLLFLGGILPEFMIFDIFEHPWWHSLLLGVFYIAVYWYTAKLAKWLLNLPLAYFAGLTESQNCNLLAWWRHLLLLFAMVVCIAMDGDLLIYLCIFYAICAVTFIKAKFHALYFPLFMAYQWIYYILMLFVFLPYIVTITALAAIAGGMTTAGDGAKGTWTCGRCGRQVSNTQGGCTCG